MAGTTGILSSLTPIAPGDTITFTYTNYEGTVERRRVRVEKIGWGQTSYYPKPGFLLKGLDLDKEESRTFSVQLMEDVQHA